MALKEKNKQLFLDKEALATLALAKEGMIGPIDKLMNKDEASTTNKQKHYKNYPIPFSFILAPSGKRNQQSIINCKKGETLDIVVNKKIVGHIDVEGYYKINKQNRIENIFGMYDPNNKQINKLLNSIGDYAVSGRFDVISDKIQTYKSKIKQSVDELNAQKVAAIMLGNNILNRVHERLIRMALDRHELLVIFLKQPNTKDPISYKTRKKILNFFIDNYLPKSRVLLVPLENTYLFYGSHNLLLQCIVAANFGCTDLIVGYNNNQGIGMYYDHNQAHISLDDYKDELPLNVSLFPKFVFCNECKTLVSTRTCPHGNHHHVKYHSDSIKKLLLAGILPPALFVRREISAMVLSELFPKRFTNIQTIYDNLFSNNGIIEAKTDKDFYEELMILYQTTSLV